MKKMSYYILALWLVVITLSGCENKELCIDHPHGVPVRVEADWSKFSDLPVNMSLLFYPQNSDDVIIVHNYNPHTATTKLPVNVYDVVVFNELMGDLGGVDFYNMERFETAQVYLSDKKNIKSGSEDMVVSDPECVGIDVIRNFEITQQMLETYRNQKKLGQPTDETLLEVTPKDVVYEVEVKMPVKGLKYVHKLECTLSGMQNY